VPASGTSWPEPDLGALARFAAGLDLATTPEPVVARGSEILLDTVGVIVAGSARPEVRAMARQSELLGGGTSTIIGGPRTASVQMAALVNGTAAISLELDEGCQFAANHPSAHILPALLALSESARTSGADVLAGLIAGYEVAVRLGSAVRLRPQVHPFGTVMIAGTAAALARALRLDAATTRAAIENSLALMVATAQNAANSGSMIRNVYTGMTNAGGLVAVANARAGQTTAPEVVGAVLTQIMGTGVDLDAVSRAEPDWYLLRNYFKRHACSRWNHAPIEAMAKIRAEVDPAQVDEILVETYDPAIRLDRQEPVNWFAAKHSIPFNVVAVLLFGNCDAAVYTDEIVGRDDVRSLGRRVRVVEDKALTRLAPDVRAARVTVRTTDGREIVGYEDRAPGGFDAPFPPGWLETKCAGLITPVLGAGAFDAIRDECRALAAAPTTARLMDLLRLEPSTSPYSQRIEEPIQ
jgi:2-methylcitrate dehydratase PrpD